MEIFIGNIPKKMSAFELQRLVNRALVPDSMIESVFRLVRRKDRIKRLEFNVVTEIKASHTVRYGKAIIEPDPAAKFIIKKLNNLPCRGSLLKVREFGHRSYNNERRSLGSKTRAAAPSATTERRNGDRRVSTTEFQ